METMPSVRTCVVMLSAFGTELEVVSAGGCSTITPVDDACRVGYAVFDLHGLGRYLPCGDVDALVAHDTGFDAAFRVGGHAGHGQHAAHRVDVVGQRFHDRGVVGAEQRHVVGRDGLGGVSGHRLHFNASQAGRREWILA